MRAAIVRDGHIVIEDRPIPEPTEHEVLVRVAGAGLNRADLLQRMGFYPAPAGSTADIPGLEFSGTVEALGASVHGLNLGDRVFGVTGGGAQAQYLCVHETHCAIVPANLDLVIAGAIPEAFVTAHDAMITHAGLKAGDWMMVHAVGSGVGTTALQLGNAFGANVIGTARNQDKLDRCAALGLEHAILAPALVAEATDGATGARSLDPVALAQAVKAIAPSGVDVTLDLVGGNYIEADIAAAAQHGRIVFIGTLAGGRASLDILSVMQKRLALHGTVLRPRDIAEKAAATAAFTRDVVPLLVAGTVAPVVEKVMVLDDAEAAYDLLATDTTFGTILLDCQ